MPHRPAPYQIPPEVAVVSNRKNGKRKRFEVDVNYFGPVKVRSCTDVLCCVIFGAFVFMWAILGTFAYFWGNPERLVYPTDSLGQTCGVRTSFYNLSSKPYLLFFDMTKCFSYATVLDGCLTPQVCVESCPDYYYRFQKEYYDTSLGNFENDRSKLVCVYDVDPKNFKTSADAERAISLGHCARYYLKSEPVAGRCIPAVISSFIPSDSDVKALQNLSVSNGEQKFNASAITSPSGKTFVKLLLEAKSFGTKLLADLQMAWWQILIALLASSVIAFIWIVLMRWIAAFMVYLSMFIILVASAAGTAYCWWQFVVVRKREGDGQINFRITADLESYLQMSGTWLGFAIFCSVVFTIFFLSLVCLCSRIRLAIALIGESSKAVAAMLSALFFPILPFILHLAIFTFFVSVAVYLASSGRPQCRMTSPGTEGVSNNITIPCDCDQLSQQKPSKIASAVSQLFPAGSDFNPVYPNVSNQGNLTCQFVSYKNAEYIIYMQLYNLFGFFWALFFIHGLADVTLAGAFASYYWAFRKPQDIPALPVLKAFWIAVRYHLGSIAFGSLILAIVRIIRVILEYAEEKLKNAKNPIAMGCLKCMQCFFFCLEKFLKFLSKNAYIMIAIYGRNFCVSAHEAFSLITRNIVRYVVLDKITEFLLFLGKLVITVGMGVAAYYYFAGGYRFSEFLVGHLNYFWAPIVIIVVGTYFICTAFFDVYDMAVDTTFLCFLEDCERNDGSAEKPYFMAKSLKKLLDKHNEQPTQVATARY